MKKLLALVLALLMVVAVFAACGKAEEKPATTPDNQGGQQETAKGPFDDVKPLEKAVTLTIGQLNGSHHGVS